VARFGYTKSSETPKEKAEGGIREAPTIA